MVDGAAFDEVPEDLTTRGKCWSEVPQNEEPPRLTPLCVEGGIAGNKSGPFTVSVGDRVGTRLFAKPLGGLSLRPGI